MTDPEKKRSVYLIYESRMKRGICFTIIACYLQVFFSFILMKDIIVISPNRADGWKDPSHDRPVHNGLTEFGKVRLLLSWRSAYLRKMISNTYES